MTVDDYFATGPAHERPIFDAVMQHFEAVGPVFVEPVSVGIFLKRAGMFCELRPKDRWVAVSFSLRRHVRHRCITRKVVPYNGKYWHTANVARVEDLDDELLGYLTEAYELAPP